VDFRRSQIPHRGIGLAALGGRRRQGQLAPGLERITRLFPVFPNITRGGDRCQTRPVRAGPPFLSVRDPRAIRGP
jgi:hypothetical protein